MSTGKQKVRPAALGQGPPINGYQVGGRMWIEKRGVTFLSWGRIALLEQIRDCGSIAGAARAMGMGYRHAWELVESMNQLAPTPLVAKAAGGVRGGGARLTCAGEAAIEEFWRLVRAFRRWLDHQRLKLPGGGPCPGRAATVRRGSAGRRRETGW